MNHRTLTKLSTPAKRRTLAGGIGVAVCAVGLTAWRLDAATPPPQPISTVPSVPVVAEKVQVSDVPIVMSGIGTVAAYNVVDVHAQVTGTIEKIGFVEGQTVHPGSLIAQLDPRPFQATLQQAEANLARDQAHLDQRTDQSRTLYPADEAGISRRPSRSPTRRRR